MRLSSLGQVSTALALDDMPATTLARGGDTVNLGDGKGPSLGSLALLGGALFLVYIFTSSAPAPRGGTIRGY